MNGSFNRHGGLTLVPMPGFEDVANRVAEKVRAMATDKAEQNLHDTPVDIAYPQFGTRPSGEPYLRLGKEHIGGHDCIVITSGPGTWEMLGSLELLLRYLAARHASRITVFAAYFPLSRSDKDEGEYEFALPPLFVDLFRKAAAGSDVSLSRIVSVDLHSPQVVMSAPTGFITELSMIRRIVAMAIKDALAREERLVISYPDAGMMSRAGKAVSQVMDTLGICVPCICGIKARKSGTKVEIKEVYGPTEFIRDATVLCLDDEIATGGTNITTAALLKSEQFGAAKVIAAVTHGVLCGDASMKFLAPDCPVSSIYCSDTIPIMNRPELVQLVQSGRLRVVEWWRDLAWAVYHLHWDLSIRVVR